MGQAQEIAQGLPGAAALCAIDSNWSGAADFGHPAPLQPSSCMESIPGVHHVQQGGQQIATTQPPEETTGKLAVISLDVGATMTATILLLVQEPPQTEILVGILL